MGEGIRGNEGVSAPALIGVDWGTTNFRAFLIGADGAILDRRSGPRGILTVEDGAFSAALRSQVGAWLDDGAAPVLLSGMIGSRQGWVETAYVTVPAGLEDFAASLVEAPFEAADARIVPGVEMAGATMRDVMRGEETQIFGALAQAGAGEGRFLLPGTHAKWVSVEEGRIVHFSTYMTGEIFSAARHHTILGRLMRGDGEDTPGFLHGVRDGARSGGPGALLHRLFGVRTAGLFGDIADTALADYLSGLLIGSEVADAGRTDARPVAIVASDALAARYAAAAKEIGIAASTVPSDCIALGYLAIARAAGLVAGN